MNNLIHPLSHDALKNIGEYSFIYQYSIMLTGAGIGHNCNVNPHCFTEDDKSFVVASVAQIGVEEVAGFINTFFAK